MDKEFLQKLADKHESSLRLIAKDMETLARMTKKTKMEDEDKFQANLVQGAFYFTAYTLGTKAFNRMVDEKQRDPSCTRGQVDYFLDEILEMQKNNMEVERKVKEAKEAKDAN